METTGTQDQRERADNLAEKKHMTVEEMYPPRFFARRHRMMWRVEPVCSAVAGCLEFKTIIDVGCAIGDLVKGFVDMGYMAVGIEGSKSVKPYLVVPEEKVFFHDLRMSFPIRLRTFDVALCLEVAEHIEEEFVDVFLDNLTELSRQILLSAAHPGQGGHHHFNCQSPRYWEEKMWLRGYARKREIEDEFRVPLIPWRHKPGVKAYFNNILAFLKVVG